MSKEMASNNVFFCQGFDPTHKKRTSRVMEAEAESGINSQVLRRKRPKTWSSQRYSISAHEGKGSVSCSKPKLYTQPSYIGPTGFEPFSTFKRPVIADEEQEDECFPTALCNALGCWQTERHSHDATLESKVDSREYVYPGTLCASLMLEENLPKSSTDQQVSDVTLQKMRSPLVVEPISTTGRIPRPLPVRTRRKLSIDAPELPNSSSLQDPCLASTTSSLLDSNFKGPQDHNTLSRLSKSYGTSIPSASQYGEWQVNLSTHRKPRPQRDHKKVVLEEAESVAKRQGAAISSVMLTGLPGNEVSRVARGLEKVRLVSETDMDATSFPNIGVEGTFTHEENRS